MSHLASVTSRRCTDTGIGPSSWSFLSSSGLYLCRRPLLLLFWSLWRRPCLPVKLPARVIVCSALCFTCVIVFPPSCLFKPCPPGTSAGISDFLILSFATLNKFSRTRWFRLCPHPSTWRPWRWRPQSCCAACWLTGFTGFNSNHLQSNSENST